MLYSRFSPVIYFIHSSIYMSVPTSQFIPCPLPSLVSMFVLYICEKQPKCPSTEGWIKKVWYICTMEYYSAIKGQKSAACRNVDGTEAATQREVSQKEKNK